MLFIAFTLAFLLWFVKKGNQSANRFLAIIVTIAALWIGQIVGIDSKLFSYNPIWNLLPLHYSLALGPLLYFYVRSVIYPKHKLKRQDLLHFVPSLLELSFYLLQANETIKTGVINYNSLLFQLSNSGIRFLTFISVIVYLYRCYILIQNFHKEIKFNGSDRYRYELRWLQNLLSGLGLIWLLWIPFTVADYCFYRYELSVQTYYPIYFLLMSTLICMAAKAFLRQEIEVKA
ncbi:MAG: macrolide transporter ATP-binding/permease protein, partial [Mucilaginibacter sp.]|nr:macrolide transporter ATP-binding/permease protein [Mucilaginibacter sp.]